MNHFLLGYFLPATVALLAIPMALGKVPPNGLYGFRTSKTLSSPEIWYPANRAAGGFMLAAAVLAFGFCLVLLSVGAAWPQITLYRSMVAAKMVPLLLSLAAAFVYLRRLQ